MGEVDRVEDKANEEQLFSELVLNEKEITYKREPDGFDLTIIIKKPNLRQKRHAESLYSKEFNKLLQDSDQLTTEQLLDIAKKRGIWSEADSTRFESIDSVIIAAKAELKELDSSATEEVDLAQTKLGELRVEKLLLTSKLGKIVGTSIESSADRARTEYLVSQCVFKVGESGNLSLLYSNIDELRNEENTDKAERISLDAVTFWRGEGLSDFLHLED